MNVYQKMRWSGNVLNCLYQEESKAKALIDLIRNNPYQTPPSYEKLQGDLQGVYSRRINIKHRLVYEVYEDARTVKIISLWSHYEF